MGWSSRACSVVSAPGCQRSATDSADAAACRASGRPQLAAYGSGSMGSPSSTSNTSCARPWLMSSAAAPLPAKATLRMGSTCRYRLGSARPCTCIGTLAWPCCCAAQAMRRVPSGSAIKDRLVSVASHGNGWPLAARGKSQRLRSWPPAAVRLSAALRRLMKRRSARPWPQSMRLRAGPHSDRASCSAASGRRERSSSPSALAVRRGSTSARRPVATPGAVPPRLQLSTPCSATDSVPPCAASNACSIGTWVTGSDQMPRRTAQVPSKLASAERLPATVHAGAGAG